MLCFVVLLLVVVAYKFNMPWLVPPLLVKQTPVSVNLCLVELCFWADGHVHTVPSAEMCSISLMKSVIRKYKIAICHGANVPGEWDNLKLKCICFLRHNKVLLRVYCAVFSVTIIHLVSNCLEFTLDFQVLGYNILAL